jgi:hypothetical protein
MSAPKCIGRELTKANDKVALREILIKAKFTEIEVESLVWSNGDIPELPTAKEKKKRLIDDIVGRIGTGIVTGLVLGGIFVYGSAGLSEHDTQSRKSDKLMSDYRSPRGGLLQAIPVGLWHRIGGRIDNRRIVPDWPHER